MTLRRAVLGALALPGLAVPALAQAPVTGLYVAGGGGVNWVQRSDLTVVGPAGAILSAAGVSRSARVSFDPGWVGALSLGWGFGNGVRAEVEGSVRGNSVDRVSGLAGAGPIGLPRGNQFTYAVMGNAFFDFPTGTAFRPYIGAGLGYAWTEWDKVRATALATGDRLAVDDTDGRFAYQAIAGVGYDVAAVPGLAITAEYRFFGTLDNEYSATIWRGNGQPPLRGRVEAENRNHSLLLGVRYAFNQPRPAAAAVAPAPAPAAAPAPARTYLVFFDWDRSNLTDRARQIIAEAAQNARRVGSTRIEVAGHADRSGTPQYNQGLSMRRAEAVAAELARQGIQRSEMVIQAFGESRPLVPTADGVREPQNRRVEIVLR